MSNPLGRLFDREAQELTAQIDSATGNTGSDYSDDGLGNGGEGVVENTVTDREAGRNEFNPSEVMAGKPVDETLGAKNVIDAMNNALPLDGSLGTQAIEAADRGGLVQARNLDNEKNSEMSPARGGLSAEELDVEAPIEVSEELAHERNLARAEGDILVQKVQQPQKVQSLQEVQQLQEAQRPQETQRVQEVQSPQEIHRLQGAQEFQEPLEFQNDDEIVWDEARNRGQDAERNDGDIVSVVDSDQDREAQNREAQDRDRWGSDSGGNIISTDITDASSAVDRKFVNSERALAEGTMDAVKHLTFGKGETRLVDLVALYEKGAAAMHETDRRVI